MKKALSMLIAIIASLSAYSQTIEVYKGDKLVATFTQHQADKVVFRESVTHECIDLGLSVKWATCNVGATSPEKCGEYFAWGEISSKSEYTWNNYRWYDSTDGYLKYNNEKNQKGYDGKTTLEYADDAASANWGDSWRMPTVAEFEELIDNCNCEWTEINGIKGRKFSSKVFGYIGNYIFLPAAGSIINKDKSQINEVGRYWTSTLLPDNRNNAHSVFFAEHDNYYPGINYSQSREQGFTIRPVCP